MKKNKIIFALAIILVGVGGSIFWSKRDTQQPIKFKEHVLSRGDIGIKILATGTVLPENRLEIKPPLAGRIEEILVQEGQKVKKGQILAWMSSTERAAMMDAAQAEGPDQVKHWAELYKRTPVIAPITGTIILRNTEAGQTFTSNDAVLVMANHLTIKAQVDETDISQVKLKQAVEVELDAYPGKKIEAQVDQIAYDAKTVNNVTFYVVDVLPKNPPPYMRSGMTANVTFYTDVRQQVLWVPTEAIKYQNQKTVVTVKTAENKTEEREIQIGISDGKRTEVQSGIKEGDLLMIAQLQAGERKNNGSSPFSPMGSRPQNNSRSSHPR